MLLEHGQAFSATPYSAPDQENERLDQVERELNQYKQAMAPQQYMTAPLQGPISPAMRRVASQGTLERPTQQPLFAQRPQQEPWAPRFNSTSKQHQEVMAAHQELLQVVATQQETHRQLMAAHAELMAAKAQASFRGEFLDQERAKPPSLGVVRLDYDYPPAEGDVDCPGSFGYDVYYRVVPGLTLQVAQDGKLTEEIERNFSDAIKYLEQRGVSAIIGDCGFMMAFQTIARKIASVPVCMSSLVQCPIISAAIDDNDKILILTANSKFLTLQKQVLLEQCGFKVEDDKFIIVGCQDVEGFDAIAKGRKMPLNVVQPGIVRLAADVLRRHPDIGAILFECTELPPFADALRQALRLPVFDAITCADFYVSAKQDNPRFGVNEWVEHWDGVQEEYTFGQNLIDIEKAALVNKISRGRPYAPNKMTVSSTVRKLARRKHPALGVLRLDHNYLPGTGDIDHQGSYDYRILFRCVPGLTLDMAQSGCMTRPVLEEFKHAIKWLEQEGCCGITGECGFMMAFQVIARRVAKVPVFMSSVVQCPMISVSLDKYEKILVLTASSDALLRQKEVILTHCGFEVSSERFVILGCEDVLGLNAMADGKQVDVELVTPRMVKFVQERLQKEPAIRAILSECVELPPYSDALRAVTRLPVFDAITMCDFFMSANEDNPRFGLNQWQNEWKEQAAENRLGVKELTQEERRTLLNLP